MTQTEDRATPPKLQAERRQLRVGIIGLGVGEQHLLGYEGHPACVVEVVCDLNEEKLTEVHRRHPHVRKTQIVGDVLDDPRVDVVSIASYDSDHFQQVMAALRGGKHVFVEKPLCQTLKQLREIKDAWEQHHGAVKLQSNLVLRAAPLYAWLKRNIESFGELYAIDGDYLYGRLSKITQGWRGNLDYYSVMAGGGVHLIDLLLWLTGSRPETVSAMGNRICTRGSAFRFEDFASANLKFPSGLIARITANFGCVHGHQHVLRVFGTKGTLLYDDQGPRVQFERDPAPPAKQLLDVASLPPSKYALIPEFIDIISEDRDVDMSTNAHFDAMSVCFACEEALRTEDTKAVEYA